MEFHELVQAQIAEIDVLGNRIGDEIEDLHRQMKPLQEQLDILRRQRYPLAEYLQSIGKPYETPVIE